MNATITARTAIAAHDRAQRHRRSSAILDRISDGAMAAGGVLFANSILPLGFDLPAGRIGMSAGGALIAAAIAWMRRPRRMPQSRPMPAPQPAAVPLAVVVPINARHAA